MKITGTLFVTFALVSSFATAADWPTWRGPERSGLSPDQGLLKKWADDGPKLLWNYRDAGKGYSSPAVVGDRIFLTGTREEEALIICLARSSGKELWTAPIGDDEGEGYLTKWGGGTRGAVTVDDGIVYAVNANGQLTAVSAKDGKRQWSKSFTKDFNGKVPKWGYSESPLVDGDKLLVTPGGEGGAIVALDKKTGKTIWKSKGLDDEAQYSSLIIAKGDGVPKQYVQFFMNKLAGVDAETGELLWSSPWPQGRTAMIPTPIYHDGHVYMTGGYGSGCKLVDIRDNKAEVVWENKVMKNHHGGVVLVGEYLYGFSDGGGLVCQSWETGERVWNEKGDGIEKGAVRYADGMLYCVDEREGSVFLVEATADGYRERGRFPLQEETELRKGTNGKVWAHPVILDGKLYLRDQDLFWCYDVKE